MTVSVVRLFVQLVVMTLFQVLRQFSFVPECLEKKNSFSTLFFLKLSNLPLDKTRTPFAAFVSASQVFAPTCDKRLPGRFRRTALFRALLRAAPNDLPGQSPSHKTCTRTKISSLR